MAFPPLGSGRISILGTSNNGAEIWDTSFWVDDVVVASNLDANVVLTQIASFFVTNFRTPLAALIGTDSAVSQIKGYFYAGGSPTASWVSAVASGATGTGVGNTPLQTCMVNTLRTQASGRSFRGRMYLPAHGTSLSTGHTFGTAVTTPTAAGLANFFTAINGGSLSGSVCVWSPTRGVMTPVTQITVDQKPDIQRRRANKQASGSLVASNVTPR